MLESRHPLAIDLGLERVRAVWQRMDRPRPAASLFTVAGTNGKGSTTAYIGAMLMALGYRCGTYTSPHLFRYNERIQIHGKAVPDRDLIGAFAWVEAALGDISLSYFEFGTLAAFALLSRAQLDFAILEVGLGGRLDAVNILDTDCAVITPIGLDHQDYLGHDLDSIGREKAGIIRAGKPVICGEADPPQSLLEIARQSGAPLQRLGREFKVTASASDYCWRRGSRSVHLPKPSMVGLHQVNNMATAVAAVAALLPGSLDDPHLMAQGLSSVSIAGRLQPSKECPRVWLDVGHNEHAAQAVAAALQDLHLRPAFCVLGMLRDKNAAAVAAALDEYVQNWCCAGIGGERGRSGSELARDVIKVSGHQRTRDFPDVRSALQRALEASAPDESILVFGSFVTVAQASAFLSSNC
jgi:dihydrofolate synthase/folylpolyglutamate synthase